MNWIWCTSTTLSGLIIIINPLVLGHESVNAWIVEESRKEKDVDDIIDTDRGQYHSIIYSTRNVRES